MKMDTIPLTISNVAISILLATLLIWAWRVLNWVWFRPKKLERCLRKQGLAGKPYRVFYGDSRENLLMIKQAKSKPIEFTNNIAPRAVPFIHLIVKNYGKNSYIWFGPTPRLIIMDPQLLKEIFNKFDDFQKWAARNPLGKILATGLISHEGQKWAKHRKIINPAFHLEKLKLMVPAFNEACSEMIEKWKNLVRKEASGHELDVWPYLQSLSSDVISRTAFGSNYQEGKRIFDLLRELVEHFVKVMNTVYIPGWRFLPTEANKRMKEIDKEIKQQMMGIISKREKALRAGEVANDDLLGLLMESNFREIEEHENDNKNGMSIEEVVEECRLFYFAGQATTASLLVWTMVLLAKHQDWQDKAREEVKAAFGDNKPDFDGLNHLKIVNMILQEVLRLYPAVVLPTRTIDKEMKLGKLTLPAGVEVTMPTMLIHHDFEIWGDDALEFKPERFSDGVLKATKSEVAAFFPFGWGPRICIGQNFALVEAKVALSMILQNFRFEISPAYTHAPVSIGPLKPQHGAHLILHKL